MKYWLLIGMLLGQAPEKPWIAYIGDGRVNVHFQAGADTACVVFQQVGRDYAPVSCTWLEPHETEFEDDTLFRFIVDPGTGKPLDTDWEIHATVHYPAAPVVWSEVIEVHY